MFYQVRDTTSVVTSGQVQTTVYTIAELPTEAKPREKLLEQGPAALSVLELVAVLLEKGTRKEDVLSMATRVLSEYGERSLHDFRDAKRLAQDLDIPITRAMKLVASAELSRRWQQHPHGAVSIRTPEDVYSYTKDMRELKKEHLRGLYLNAHHQVIHDETISIGTINTSVIHPREVFKPALLYGALALVLVHNHPSGDVTPSLTDEAITAQLYTAGQLMGIELLDHVIVSAEGFQQVTIST